MKVTIELKDREDGGVALKAIFDPPLDKDNSRTPATDMAVLLLDSLEKTMNDGGMQHEFTSYEPAEGCNPGTIEELRS
jgi:hypothetical protein